MRLIVRLASVGGAAVVSALVAGARPIGSASADAPAQPAAPAAPAESPVPRPPLRPAALAFGVQAGPALASALPADPVGAHEFYFTRAIDTSGSFGRRWGDRWAIDYPKADLQFLVGLKRQTIIDAYASDNAVRLDDPALRRFPFVYALEVGGMSLTDSEVEGLRSYLMAGGFLMIDDFWGTYEWENFAFEIRRVLPEFPIVDVPRDHPIFNAFYNIDEIVQVPNVRQGINSVYGGPTHERDGFVPQVRGIFDHDGRLMVGINWNTDLGDAWEWADNPYYPLKFSTYAWAVGINFIVYAMTH